MKKQSKQQQPKVSANPIPDLPDRTYPIRIRSQRHLALVAFLERHYGIRAQAIIEDHVTTWLHNLVDCEDLPNIWLGGEKYPERRKPAQPASLST